MPSETHPPPGRQPVLTRLLAVVTEVRPGEGGTALLLTLDIFLTLTAYSIIKPVREALILTSAGGAEYKSYATGAVAALLLVAVPVYSRVASRLERHRLVIGVLAFFVACLVGFWLLSGVASVRPGLAIPFYLWVGIFNMMVVAQFWAFANDVYTKEQGLRLFPLLGIGQSLGAAWGSQITTKLLDPPAWLPWGRQSPYTLLLVSAGMLLVTAVLTYAVHLRQRVPGVRGATGLPPGASGGRAAPPPSMGHRDGFALVFGNRYLALLAAFAVVFTLVNTNGEYMLSVAVEDAARAAGAEGLSPAAWIGRFYGRFYFGVNVAALVIQTLLVSRIVRHGGLRLASLLLPAIVFAGAGLVALVPALAVLRVTKSAENATDYSLNNTVRNMFWLPTTQEMKYKAKQAVDTFFVRLGDLASAGLVLASSLWLSLGLRGFALVNVVLALGWAWIAYRIVTSPELRAEGR